MNTNKKINLLVITLISTALLLIILFRLTQIWINPIDDFDTSSFLLMIQGGFYPKTLFFFDIAHPGLFAGIIKACQSIQESTNFHPIYIWSMLIVSGILFACTCLFYLMKKLGCSTQVALLTCCFYLMSPAISDIAARSEENILFHAPFILVIWICSAYIKKPSATLGILVFFSAIVLAAQHVQPFLIVSGGLCFFVCSEFLAKIYKSDNTLKTALSIFLLFAATGFIYYFVMHYVFYNPMVVKAYSNNTYSLFHNDSYTRYLQAYLLFAQGYIFTGDLPINYATSHGVYPKNSIWLLGIITISIAFILTTRRRFIDFFTLPALGFAFLYEPSASERWDTVVIAMTISLLSRLSTTSKDTNKNKRKYIWPLVALIFVLNGFALKGQINQTSDIAKVQKFIGSELEFGKVIYADPDSARILIHQSPRWIEFRNINSLTPSTAQLGDAIYIKDSILVAKNKFNLNCKPTKVADLCLIGY